MFIGHFAVGFAAKRQTKPVSLGTLFLAVQFLDLLWPTFLLLGWEQVRIVPGMTAVNPFDFTSYPYSHSLVAALGWSIAFGAIYWLLRRRSGNALILGLAVFSHWVLDYVTHIPDLPITIHGTAKVGLGLWRSLPATLAVEGLIFIVGVAIYARTTKARDRAGRFGFWGLVAFLLIAHLAAIYGPVPTDIKALAWGGQSIWLLVLWGYWLDRHREPAGQYA
ncbi:MAG TPA: hypothetical protein VGS22_07335 [Thermoanaerobaculia bacterium]|jgi:hypothetical protein|nr:hypothetical protein [Thermoanaerobaculia bacterium]